MYNILVKCGIFLIFSILIVDMDLTNAQARVIVNEKEKFYYIRGKTGEQILKSVLKSGPIVSKEKTFGSTKIKFDFKNLRVLPLRGRCRITNIDVILTLLHTYPKWQNLKDANVASRKNWNRFSDQIRRHQRKRKSIAVRTAHKMERYLKQGRKAVLTKCGGLTKSGTRTLDSYIAAHNRRQAQFDMREQSNYSRTTRSLITFLEGI
ncbi:MAG: DUF922 domain-containing protein [Rhizobiaceae bacterium]|nr:DUF922 domain-containing protein [Rhizobiaceae bacterium]